MLYITQGNHDCLMAPIPGLRNKEVCLMYQWVTLRHILGEYGNLFCKSPYSFQMREKNSHQKKAPNTDTFHTVVRFYGS